MSSDYTAITTAVTSGLQTVSSQAVTMVGNVVPAALVVMGAVLVITIGIRVFRRVAGK